MFTCIHNTIRNGQCKQVAFNRRTHGLLCFEHYRMQQESIPTKPRLPQGVWRGLTQQHDDAIIADIIISDIKAIAAGRIVTVRKGNNDPVFFRTLEALE